MNCQTSYLSCNMHKHIWEKGLCLRSRSLLESYTDSSSTESSTDFHCYLLCSRSWHDCRRRLWPLYPSSTSFTRKTPTTHIWVQFTQYERKVELLIDDHFTQDEFSLEKWWWLNFAHWSKNEILASGYNFSRPEPESEFANLIPNRDVKIFTEEIAIWKD